MVVAPTYPAASIKCYLEMNKREDAAGVRQQPTDTCKLFIQSKSKDHSIFQAGSCQGWAQISKYLCRLVDRLDEAWNKGREGKEGKDENQEKQEPFHGLFSHYHHHAFISSVWRGKKFSIESSGQFCVIFHFIAYFSCQLWQQLLSPSLPASPVAFLPWHQFRILPHPIL